MAVLFPYTDFDANVDAQVLHDAMKGLGTDEDAIIDVLAHRTVDQRKEIEVAFKAQFGEDLKKKLKSELRGDFEKVILWSFYNQAELNAAALQAAMKGSGTDENMLIEVICTASNSKICAMKEAFETMTGKSLEDAIESECSGDFKRALIAIIQGCRQKGCDSDQAQIDAQELYSAGEGKWGTDESTFIRLMCNSSFKQIQLIDRFYQDISDHDLLTAIEKELSGDFEKAMKCIVSYAHDRLGTLADILYRSMKGVGTHDHSLMRIILGHAETNLGLIRQHFDETYDKTLEEMISGDTSGDYRKFLLAILQ